MGDDGTHGPDATPANNSATDIDTLAAAPDLVITKSDGGVSTIPDGMVTYTLTYTNTGTQDATGVIITEESAGQYQLRRVQQHAWLGLHTQRRRW